MFITPKQSKTTHKHLLPKSIMQLLLHLTTAQQTRLNRLNRLSEPGQLDQLVESDRQTRLSEPDRLNQANRIAIRKSGNQQVNRVNQENSQKNRREKSSIKPSKSKKIIPSYGTNN